jgi:hypothetical protein
LCVLRNYCKVTQYNFWGGRIPIGNNIQ